MLMTFITLLNYIILTVIFFFSSRRRHTRSDRDWSSDVCSSDLGRNSVNFFPPGYPEKFTEFLPALRYERIMEVFGGHTEWVTEPSELRPALERAVTSGRPACINVSVDPNASHPGFWLAIRSHAQISIQDIL